MAILKLRDRRKRRKEKLRLLEVLERIFRVLRKKAIFDGMTPSDLPTKPTDPPDTETDD